MDKQTEANLAAKARWEAAAAAVRKAGVCADDDHRIHDERLDGAIAQFGLRTVAALFACQAARGDGRVKRATVERARRFVDSLGLDGRLAEELGWTHHVHPSCLDYLVGRLLDRLEGGEE